MNIDKRIFWILPIIVMALGVLPMPYGYYNLSRLVVCVCSVYFAFQLFKKEDIVFVWIFGFFAILYNPIIPIHLYEKAIWIVINVITIFFFLSKRKSI